MKILKIQQNINNQEESRVTLKITIEGQEYKLEGFSNKECTAFELAKNEPSYLVDFLEKLIAPVIKQALKDDEIQALEARLIELKSITK